MLQKYNELDVVEVTPEQFKKSYTTVSRWLQNESLVETEPEAIPVSDLPPKPRSSSDVYLNFFEPQDADVTKGKNVRQEISLTGNETWKGRRQNRGFPPKQRSQNLTEKPQRRQHQPLNFEKKKLTKVHNYPAQQPMNQWQPQQQNQREIPPRFERVPPTEVKTEKIEAAETSANAGQENESEKFDDCELAFLKPTLGDNNGLDCVLLESTEMSPDLFYVVPTDIPSQAVIMDFIKMSEQLNAYFQDSCIPPKDHACQIRTLRIGTLVAVDTKENVSIHYLPPPNFLSVFLSKIKVFCFNFLLFDTLMVI